MRFLHLVTGLNCAVNILASSEQCQTGLAGKNLKILPLGDSITYGYGSSTGNGYRQDLLQSLQASGATVDYVGLVQSGSMMDNDNEGLPGYRIDEIQAALGAVFSAAIAVDVVLLHAGTNDVAQSYDPLNTANRLGTLVDVLTTEWPNATIIVSKIIVTTLLTAEVNRILYNAELDSVVSTRVDMGKRVKLVDMSSLLDPSIDLFDNVHPNDMGYVKMAGIWFGGLSSGTVAWKVDVCGASRVHKLQDERVEVIRSRAQ